MNTTIAVCAKCGRTQEWNQAKAAGWLIASIPDTDGHMIIRCPEHITGHALRKAGLPQQSTSKRIKDNIERGLWTEYGNGYIASVGWQPPDFETDECYYISYHQGEMPAFNSERFKTITALILAMRKIEPDLRKWILAE